VLGETGANADAAAARARAAALKPRARRRGREIWPSSMRTSMPRAPDDAGERQYGEAPPTHAAATAAGALALARAHRHKGYLAQAIDVLARARASGDDVSCAREAASCRCWRDTPRPR
jgi:hypothetical protein